MLAYELPARAPEVARVGLVGHHLSGDGVSVLLRAVIRRQNEVSVPAARDLHHSKGQQNPQNHPGAESDSDSHGRRIVPRLRYAWRCISCRRILMRHHQPLTVIAALVGALHVKCHCNEDNWLAA